MKISFGTILLLTVFSFVLFASYLPGITYFTFAFSLLVLVLIPWRIYGDSNANLLLLFSLLYGLMPLAIYNDYSPNDLICCIVPSAFYLFGKKMPKVFNSESSLLYLSAIALLLFAINTYYACVRDILETGSLINYNRVLSRVVGQDEMQMSATAFGVNVSLGLVGLASFILCNDRNLAQYFLLGLFLLSLLTTIHLINRAGVLVAGMATLLLFVLSFGKANKKKIIYSLLILSSIILLLIISGVISIEILEAYTNRSQTEANSGLFNAGSRSWRWIDGLKKLLVMPLGYKDLMPEDYFVHNMWLDVSLVSGLIPFIILIIISVRMARQSWIFYRNSNCDLSLLLLGIMICFFISSFQEPILIGEKVNFYMACFFWGISSEYKKKVSTRNNY